MFKFFTKLITYIIDVIYPDKEIVEIYNDEWEVLTDTGWQDFDGVIKTKPFNVYELETETEKLSGADNHIVIDENNNEIFIKDCIPNKTKIQTKSGIELITLVNQTNKFEYMYDLLNVDTSVYYTNNILSHNSTAFACYILHYILFNEDKTVALLANKAKQSKEILSRVKLAYENLPFWLQQGVTKWNQTEIQFENGCKVMAGSTSSDSIRGESISLLIIDEVSHIKGTLWDEFYTSTYPTISSAKTSRIIFVSCVTKDTMIFTNQGIKEINDFIIPDKEGGYEVKEYSVEGKDGKKYGTTMYNNGIADTRIISTTSSSIECSLEHKLWACRDGDFGWYKSKELKEGDYISISYGNNIWGNDDLSDVKIPTGIQRKTNNTFNFNYLTTDISYLIGLYISEGCGNKRYNSKNENVYMGITLTCGDDVSEAISNCGLRFSKTKNDNLHYHINSKSFASFLETVGFDLSVKAPQKIIPKRLMGISRENMKHLIMGIMDGDGYSRKDKGTVGINLSSKRLIEQIRIIFSNFGILTDYLKGITPPTKLVKVESNYYRLMLNDKNSNIYYDKIGFDFERKQSNRQYLKHINSTRLGNQDDIIPHSKDRIREYKKQYPHSKHFNFNGERKDLQHYSRSKMLLYKSLMLPELNEYFEDNVNEHIKWEKIKSIETSRNEVYDFSLNDVKNDKWCHSVLYNGIIGHNTPKGMNHFYKIWSDAERGISKFSPVRVRWEEVPGYDEEWKKDTIANFGERNFDQEFSCSFLSSAASLISSKAIENMEFHTPISPKKLEVFDMIEEINELYPTYMTVYNLPKENHTYSLGLDAAKITEESSGDCLAIQIIDITTRPYEQVLSVNIPHGIHYLEVPEFTNILGNYYNEAWVMIENNDGAGQEIADTLLIEYEYENVYSEKPAIMGFRTTMKNKKIGCLALKMLVEKERFILKDLATINQLSVFIKTGPSYKAEKGYNDDLVMSLVHSFIFLQDKMYFEDKIDFIEELIIPEEYKRKQKKEIKINKYFKEYKVDTDITMLNLSQIKEVEKYIENVIFHGIYVEGIAKELIVNEIKRIYEEKEVEKELDQEPPDFFLSSELEHEYSIF